MSPSIRLVPFTLGPYRGDVLASLDAGSCTRALEPLLASGFDAARPVSRSRDREVYRVLVDPADRAGLGGATELYVKRYRIAAAWPWLESMAGMHKSQRAWRVGHVLRARAVRTPRPIARAWRRLGVCEVERVVVTEGVAGGVSLRDHVASWRPSATVGAPSDAAVLARKRALIREVATLLAHLHLARAYHGDFTARNLLVAPGPSGGLELHLLDLDAVRHAWRISRRRRVKNLDEIGRNVLDLRVVTTADRLRFLDQYLRVSIAGTARRETLHALFRMVHRRTIARLRKYGQGFCRG